MKLEPITLIDGSILLQGGPTRTLRTTLQITVLHGRWLGRAWPNDDHLAGPTAEENAETCADNQ